MADIGFLLIGHGTRNRIGQQQFLDVHEEFRRLVAPHLSIACFLELAEPSIEAALRQFADQGIEHIITVPTLLFSAGHAQTDIPEAVLAGAEKYGIRVLGQSRELGCSPNLLSLSAQKYRQVLCDCLAECGKGQCPQVALGMIGRGSRSESATQKMLEFATLRHQITPAVFQTTGFVYGQEPNLERTLDILQERPEPVVVVQPHLLFQGDLYDLIRASVYGRQAADRSKHWLVPDVLGGVTTASQVSCGIGGKGSDNRGIGEVAHPQKILAKALADLAQHTLAEVCKTGTCRV